MNVKVSDVVDAQGGIVLSRKEAKSPDEYSRVYRRLTLRSLNEDGYVDDAELEYFYATEPLEDALFTQTGDVAVRLSYPLFPVLITTDSQGILVPSQIAILRVKDSTTIIPGYLRLYLAQRSVQERVKEIESGTAQRTVKIGTILDLQIVVPDLKTQKEVVSIDELSRKRERLYRSLIDQERSLTERIIENIIGGTAK
ncbi:MAG: hypothetical protein LUC47_06635 [Clostridiales bacterium]|nr:hypothetical protein [Clostridiales bacterium]